MTTGLAREFDALRKDIQRAYASPLTAKNGVELSAEFERLSGAIQSLSEKTDDKNIKLLRLELEQVRGALDTLAREDTVRSVDRRWDDFDARFSKFEDRFDAQSRGRAPDPAIEALTSRLEQINEAVNGLPESLSLRSLEEKVRTLAGAVDHFARQQDGTGNAPFDVIEERLDEISRAIVASTATATTQHFDPEPFERIEARITSLARQIEELVEDGPGGEVMDRLNLLSQRVDEIAATGKLPDKAIERLAGQVAAIADKLDRAPATPDTDHIFRGIEQRFDMLSDLLDRRQGDAMEHSQAVFRDLERRLEELAGRLDERSSAQAVDSAGIMNVIDARSRSLAGRHRRARLGSRRRQRRHHERHRRPLRGTRTAAGKPSASASTRRHRQSRSAPGRHLHAARELQHASRERRSRHHPQSGIAGVRTVAASCQAGRRAARIRGHRAAARRHRAVACGKPRFHPGGRAAGCRERGPLVRRFEIRLRRRVGACRRSEIARRAGPALRRAQHQDVRGHPRHAAQDRRPAGLARRARQPAFAEPALPAEPARKMALRDAPSIEPDEDMRMAAGSRRVASRARCATSRRCKRSPAEAAAEAAVAALDTDKAEPSLPPAAARCSAASRASSRGKKQRTEPTMTEAAVAARHGSASADARSRAAARPQARQPSARAGFRHARPQRDHAAGARRTRAAGQEQRDRRRQVRLHRRRAARRPGGSRRSGNHEAASRHRRAGPQHEARQPVQLQAQAAPDGRRGDPGRARRAAARQGFPDRRRRNRRRPAGAGPCRRAGRTATGRPSQTEMAEPPLPAEPRQPTNDDCGR